MKNIFKKFFSVLFIFALILSAPACTGDNGKINLNIGCFPNITHSQALYGLASGSFANALGDGVNVNWYTFNAGPSEMESIRAGAIDIGYIGPTPAISGYESTMQNVTVIAGVSNAGSLLVTAHDIVLEDVLGLSGLKVAVPQFGNTQDIILRMVLHENGLASIEEGGTVEIIQQDNANIKTLLENGQIDAALVPEPWGSRLEQESGANVLLDCDDILEGNYPVAVIVVRNDFLSEHRDIVVEFLKEHIRLTQQLNDDVLSVANTVNDQIGSLTSAILNDSVLEAAYGRIIFDYNLQKSAMQIFIDACLEQGTISSNINVDSLVDLSVLEEALQELEQEAN